MTCRPWCSRRSWTLSTGCNRWLETLSSAPRGMVDQAGTCTGDRKLTQSGLLSATLSLSACCSLNDVGLVNTKPCLLCYVALMSTVIVLALPVRQVIQLSLPGVASFLLFCSGCFGDNSMPLYLFFIRMMEGVGANQCELLAPFFPSPPIFLFPPSFSAC